MTETRRCDECRYFEPQPSRTGTLGKCYEYERRPRWVSADEWCGDYEPLRQVVREKESGNQPSHDTPRGDGR